MNGHAPAPGTPVVIIGAHTVGLGVLRALRHLDIPRLLVSYDARDMGRSSRYITRLYDAPHPETEEQGFINFLLDLSKQWPDAVLLPASDAALAAVARNKPALSQYYRVGCTEWAIAEKFIDKKQTYLLAEAMGVPAPRTLVPYSEDQVLYYGRSVDFPCLVKPCQSHLYFDIFHRKMVMVHNLEQMLDAYRQARAAGVEVMLQELIPGDDTCGVNYNSYFWGGEPLVEFTARKVRNAPPELGSPCVAMSAETPEVLEPGRRILSAMGFYGYSCTEFKRDPRDGVYKLMEVNGRHNLSTLLAVYCGLNFPELHYRHLALGERPTQRAYRQGIYWIDLVRDLAYSLRRCFKQGYPLGGLLRPYYKEHVFAILDVRDPRPFVRRVSGLVRDAANGHRGL